MISASLPQNRCGAFYHAGDRIRLDETVQGGPTVAILRKLFRRSRPARRLAPAEGYRLWAEAYGRRENAFQALEAEARERLHPEIDGRAVLDVGCGKGRAARFALERGAKSAVAADFSIAMLAGDGPCRRRVACDARSLPFRPASFDLAISALVLGHVEDLHGALAALAAVVRPGGRLLISDFHPYATLAGWRRTFEDERGRTFEIEHHLHLFADYVGCFERLGLVLEALEEPRWRGTPVVFALRARKT